MQSLLRVNLTFQVVLMCLGFCLADLDVAYEWKYVDYTWESDSQRQEAVETGKYDHTNIIPYDVQLLPDGRMLVTTPRRYNNPASLSTISSDIGTGGPLLSPYPDWSWHTKTDCSGITSVNRLIVDQHFRLWLVDSGKIENVQVCPAKILAFNVTTDELIQSVEIPSELSHNSDDASKGELEITAVETSGEDDEDTWVYIADLMGYGLVIWNGDDMWRLNDEVFRPVADATEFSIGGVNFTQYLGPSISAITPAEYLKKPAMLFKPISGLYSHAVSLEDLHNSHKSGFKSTYYKATIEQYSQELSRDFSKTGGVLLVTFPSQHAIGCWNVQKPMMMTTADTLRTDETTLQYVNAIKITLNDDGVSQTFWGLSNRYQRFLTGIMDFNETNFRIMTEDLDSLVEGSVCAPQSFEIADGIEDKAFAVMES